jgi:MbtH protein
MGPLGTKAECLAFVEEHWTDMRPASLQQAMVR